MKDVTPKDVKEKFVNQASKFQSFNGRKLYFFLFLALLVYYYFVLPPIHWASVDFWLFIGLFLLGVIVIEGLNDLVERSKAHQSESASKTGLNKYRIITGLILLSLAIAGLVYVVYSPVFFSANYASMIEIQPKEFEKDFPETNLNQIPLVDRDTATRLGNRHLGALTHIVSQFEAAPDYTQVTIEGKPYRVTPLEYAGFFRWLNNFQQGIPHYIQVDNVSGEVSIQTPSQPMKYSYSDLFHRDVLRALRLKHPFTIFSKPSFEVDDQGEPYYIATTYRKRFFLREPEPNGLIILNAITGETKAYDLGQIPSWVDRVYSADLILHQVTMQGHYRNGFWNSLFAKEGVTEPTAGYNYLPIGDDLYLYTGITSVVADESNIGFILVNMRTKEAVMYPLTAAEEFSAMRSAEGSVQETSYTATFPLLINIKGRPMYILTLKDNSGLIKDYALVDVQNYQNVYVAPNVKSLIEAYASDQGQDQRLLEEIGDVSEEQGKIEAIESVVLDGYTYYYLLVDNEIYSAKIDLSKHLPFLKSGDDIHFKFNSKGEIVELQLD
ncbi:hypothetical protein [Hutsoniella sourekii]|uniref:hypothetical protein n=1 Tax=Hutsoniella sourekii TaxID=87650 RepID=UPI0004836C52|nr:hypothetical protein [Hutsoniella sourekii]